MYVNQSSVAVVDVPGDRGGRGQGMSGAAVIWLDRGEQLPDAPRCDTCGTALVEPYGWCSNCRAAYCLPCGRRHFCTPSCPTNGCLAGLCVRLVEGGSLAEAWGLPGDG